MLASTDTSYGGPGLGGWLAALVHVVAPLTAGLLINWLFVTFQKLRGRKAQTSPTAQTPDRGAAGGSDG